MAKIYNQIGALTELINRVPFASLVEIIEFKNNFNRFPEQIKADVAKKFADLQNNLRIQYNKLSEDYGRKVALTEEALNKRICRLESTIENLARNDGQGFLNFF